MPITSLDQVSEYPLTWPAHKPRAAERRSSPFQVSRAKAFGGIMEELKRWRVTRSVLSMAPQYPGRAHDPAVALWFNMPPRKRAEPVGDLRVLACDAYADVVGNMRAIGLTLEALRAVERYGAYTLEQATEGARPALPPPEQLRTDWRAVLGDVPTELTKDEALAVLQRRYRTRCAEAGEGSPVLVRLNTAMDAAKAELGRGGGA